MSDGDDAGDFKRQRTRFKPGTSGNSKGRARGSKNKRTILKEILFGTMAVRQDGKTRYIAVIDLLHQKMISEAAIGNRRAMKMILKWSDLTGSLPRFPPPEKRRCGVMRFSEYKALTGIDPDSDEFQEMYIAAKLGRPMRGSPEDNS